jgi:hypothetical protein
MRLSDRLSRLEELMDCPRYGGGGGGGPLVIKIRGGLPGGQGMHASIGPLAIEREPHETLDDFESRVIDIAIEMHAPVVVFSGLPPSGHVG